MTAQVTTPERAVDEGASQDDGGRGRREIPASVRRRLEPMKSRDWWSWAVAAWVVLIAAILRLTKLGFPTNIMFDEVYYAHEGQELLDHGVEWNYDYADEGRGPITADHNEPDFVVHPPFGKWLIAGGIWFSREVLGRSPIVDNAISTDAFGWRLAPAVFGVLAVLILTRTARRLFRSTVLGAAAGLLLALDGMHMVLSRTAILDIFVLFFVLAAFACLVVDRDRRRARWLREMENGLDPTVRGKAGRPALTWRAVPWWRLAAGVMLGLGCSVKWSVVFFVPVFAALIYLWEVGLRKTVGVRRPWRDALLDEVGWIFAMGAVMIGAYLATWAGWFASEDGYMRHHLRDGGHTELPVLGALANLWEYHLKMLELGASINGGHPYQSWPWQWLLLGRPVAFHWDGTIPCGADRCASEILLLGTPLLWWSFIPALIALTWFGISRRDWRALPIGLGAAAGILPWFYFAIGEDGKPGRTMYYFYAAPSLPFLILAVVFVLGCLMSGPGVGRFGDGQVRTSLSLPADTRRLYGTVALGVYVALVAICFWIYYPIYVGDSIPHADWWKRMLLGNRWV